jgi:hypothetical protein
MKPREIALEAAREEWKRGVNEHPGPGWGRIIDYIRDGLLWGWAARKPYRNRSFAWCGAFAAYCWAMAGLLPKIRKRHFASKYRLWRWSGKHKPNARRIAPEDIEPGDVVIVGKEPAPRSAPRSVRKDRPIWGHHIVLAEKRTANGWTCIHGNGHGYISGHGYGEGVVRSEYPMAASNPHVYRILFGARPLVADLEP